MLSNQIDSLVLFDEELGAIQLEGPFTRTIDGGQWEVSIDIGDGDEEVVEPIAETIDELGADAPAFALEGAEVTGSGRTVGADIIEGRLMVAVDDPAIVTADEIIEELESAGDD